MSILIANLKLYSPFQGQSWFYKTALLMVFTLITQLIITFSEFPMGKQVPLYLITMSFIFIFFFGQMIAMVQMDILSKPFSYCLPNHVKIPRRIIFVIGFLTVLLFTVLVLVFLQPIELNYLTVMIPVMTLAFYSLAVCITFTFSSGIKNKPSSWGIWLIYIVVLISVFNRKNFFISYNDIFTYFIVPLLCSCIFLVIAVWKILGDPELKRKCFSKPYKLGASPDAGSIDQLQKEDRRNSKNLIDMTENQSRIAPYFFYKMHKSHFFTLKHALIGKLYYLFSRHFAMNRKEPILKIILVSLIFFISGYLGNDSMQNNYNLTIRPGQLAPIFIMCFILSSIFAPSSHNLLLPEGRYLQYRISFLTWQLKCFILIFMIIFVIGASWFFKGILPEMSLFGYHFLYNNIGIYAILWALIIMPVIDLMFSYVDIPHRLALMIMLTSVLFILSSIAFFTSNIAVHTVLVMIMILATNGLFDSLLTHHWFRQDHV